MGEASPPGYLFQSIVHRLNAGILVVDADMQVVFWNHFMETHSGITAGDLCGRNLFDAFPELPRKWLERKIRGVFSLKNFAFTSWQQRPYLFRFQHHRPVTGGADYMRQECTFMPVKDETGDVRFVCITLVDATETSVYQNQLMETMASLKKASQIDGLTGLYNRHFFERRFSSEVKRAKRYGQKLCFAIFDLDHFKLINDNYGHLAGDEVLRKVAELSLDTLRETDVTGRYGGEEFAVLLPGVDLEGAMHAMERLCRVIAGMPFKYGDNTIKTTVSIGYTEMHSAIEKHEDLVREADKALYLAKASGRNQVVCAEEALERNRSVKS